MLCRPARPRLQRARYCPVHGREIPARPYLAAGSFAVGVQVICLPALANKVGAQLAQQQVRAAARQVVPDYQKRWNAQLANAYAQIFSEAQLQSLLQLGPQSPHAQLMQSKQAEVNTFMQKNSSAMLRDLLSTLLSSAQRPVTTAPAAGSSAPATK